MNIERVFMDNKCKKYTDVKAWQILTIKNGLKDIKNNDIIDFNKIKKKWK